MLHDFKTNATSVGMFGHFLSNSEVSIDRAEGAFTGTAAAPGIRNLKLSTRKVYIKFGPVPAVQPPIQPLGAPKIRCATCLPAQKVFVKKVWEKFYVGEFFYPESKIEDFRKSAFFLKKLVFEKFRFSREKMNSSKKYFIFVFYNTKRPSAHPVPRGSVSSISSDKYSA